MKGGKKIVTRISAVIATLMVAAAFLVSPVVSRKLDDEDMIRGIMQTTTREPLGDRCRVAGEYCSFWESKLCCQGLTCEGPTIGESKKCVPLPYCRPEGATCTSIVTECCYPFQCLGYPGYCGRVSSTN
ncbi:hypothetical protein L484_024014 [Morus notabilis]|uniref:Uncharacterized protein n=1 Tax=Morus notabilis TaxID=981085 RepID=W9R8R7_9ROSA|nr:hypothetical protein L484_024014 [Morus notabilis]